VALRPFVESSDELRVGEVGPIVGLGDPAGG
jgi:hypothetical protein